MFSGKFKVDKDEEGRYFIDRDGTHFRYILNFLRDGSTYIPYSNTQIVDELYEEVKYYQIQQLLEKLDKERNKNTKLTSISYTKLLELINLSVKPLQAPNLKLDKMQISYLDFSKCNFQGSDFSGVTAIEANFRSANLTNCIFDESWLKNAIFRNVIAEKCSFNNSVMNGADMRSSHWTNWEFKNAKMPGVDLRDSILDGSSLIDTNLIVANLEKASLHDWDITGANFDRANLKNIKGIDPDSLS